MENNTQQGLNSQYVPPKKWDEITSDEKIERLREIVKQQSSALGMAQTHIHNLRMKLKRHQHQDGKVVEVKEVQDYDDGNLAELVGSAKLSNKDYF